MPITRRLCSAIAALDVLLFLVATAFNDHSNTSADGLVWWAALFLFVTLIAIGVCIIGRYVWIHRRRPGRHGQRSRLRAR